MARTKYPYFSKMLVYSYCDDTEPKLFPDAYEQYAPLRELTALEQQLAERDTEIEKNGKFQDFLADEVKRLQTANAALEQKLKNSISIDAHLEWKKEWEQQLKKAEEVIEFYGDGFRLCQLISNNATFTENTITLKDENITERARQYLKSRGE